MFRWIMVPDRDHPTTETRGDYSHYQKRPPAVETSWASGNVRTDPGEIKTRMCKEGIFVLAQ